MCVQIIFISYIRPDGVKFNIFYYLSVKKAQCHTDDFLIPM
jgi:hypothetical protein